MSMGTIVTIVLVVVTLVLALVLIRSIFSSSTNAVTQIDTAIQNQINHLFTTENTNLVIYPAGQTIKIKRGDDTPRGIQFAVKNPDNNPATFTYTLNAQSMHNCGSSFTLDEANSYVIGSPGTLSAGAGAVSENQVILFQAPKGAPACTVTYSLQVQEAGSQNAFSKQVFVAFD